VDALAKLDAAGITEVQVWKDFAAVYPQHGKGRGNDRVKKKTGKDKPPPTRKARRCVQAITKDVESLREILPLWLSGNVLDTIIRNVAALRPHLELLRYYDGTSRLVVPLRIALLTEAMLFRSWGEAVKKTGKKLTGKNCAALLAEKTPEGGWWRPECEPTRGDDGKHNEDEEDRRIRIGEALRQRLNRAQKALGKEVDTSLSKWWKRGGDWHGFPLKFS
jgi:hypothetical protein